MQGGPGGRQGSWSLVSGIRARDAGQACGTTHENQCRDRCLPGWRREGHRARLVEDRPGQPYKGEHRALAHDPTSHRVVPGPVLWARMGLLRAIAAGQPGLSLIPGGHPGGPVPAPQHRVLRAHALRRSRGSSAVRDLADRCSVRSGTSESARSGISSRFFGPPAALFVVAVLSRAWLRSRRSSPTSPAIPTEFVLGVLVLALFGNLWEETSWSGFVTARLQARFGPLQGEPDRRSALRAVPPSAVLHHRRSRATVRTTCRSRNSPCTRRSF